MSIQENVKKSKNISIFENDNLIFEFHKSDNKWFHENYVISEDEIVLISEECYKNNNCVILYLLKSSNYEKYL